MATTHVVARLGLPSSWQLPRPRQPIGGPAATCGWRVTVNLRKAALSGDWTASQRRSGVLCRWSAEPLVNPGAYVGPRLGCAACHLATPLARCARPRFGAAPRASCWQERSQRRAQRSAAASSPQQPVPALQPGLHPAFQLARCCKRKAASSAGRHAAGKGQERKRRARAAAAVPTRPAAGLACALGRGAGAGLGSRVPLLRLVVGGWEGGHEGPVLGQRVLPEPGVVQRLLAADAPLLRASGTAGRCGGDRRAQQQPLPPRTHTHTHTTHVAHRIRSDARAACRQRRRLREGPGAPRRGASAPGTLPCGRQTRRDTSGVRHGRRAGGRGPCPGSHVGIQGCPCRRAVHAGSGGRSGSSPGTAPAERTAGGSPARLARGARQSPGPGPGSAAAACPPGTCPG